MDNTGTLYRVCFLMEEGSEVKYGFYRREDAERFKKQYESMNNVQSVRTLDSSQSHDPNDPK